MHYFRVIIRLALWVVVLSVAFGSSLLYHLDTPLGHRAGTTIANVAVTSLIAGRLSIGRITKLTPGRIVVRNASLYDPSGVRVIQADQIVLVLDVEAATRGVLRFSHAELNGGTLRLDQTQDGEITFLAALGARPTDTPPSGGPPFHAIVDDMHLHRLEAYGNLLGAHGLHARDVEAHMRMEFFHDLEIRVFGGHGLIDAPMDFTASLDDVVARVHSDPYIGSTVDANLHYQDEQLRVHMTYAVPGDGTPTDPAELDLQLEAHPIDLATIYRIGFDWARPFQGRGAGFVRLFGPPDRLAMSAAIEHEAGTLVLHGQLPSVGDIVIEANTPGADMARLMTGSPDVSIGGDITLVVHPATTQQPSTLHAEVRAFAFQEFAVPALTLDATLLEDRVRIDAVDAPYAQGGHLNASGYVMNDGPMHIEVEGTVGDVRNDPNVQRFVPGARGRTTLRATVDRADDVTTVMARGTITDLVYSDVIASSLHFDLDARTRGDATRLVVETRATDLRAGPIMLGDGTANIRSARGGYEVEGSFYDPRADGRVAMTGFLRTRGNTSSLTTPVIRYERHGVRLVLRANHVELTPHRTMIADAVELSINDAAAMRFDAHWLSRGQDAAQLVIDQLPLRALSQLFSPMLPDLDGTLSGRAVLSGDLETSPRVDIRTTIANGRVRTLQGINGQFDAQLDHGAILGKLDLDAADGGHVTINMTGTAPISLPNFQSAIREGQYQSHANFESIDLGRVAAGLLGMTDAGVGGCMDGTMDFGGYLAFEPNFDAALSIGDLEFGGSPPVEVALASHYDGENLEATASIGADTSQQPRGGRSGRCSEQASAHLQDADTFAAEGLAEAYGNIRAPLIELFDAPGSFASLLQLVPWGLSVRVPPRDFSSLPASWQSLIPASLHDFRGAASMSALGGFGMVQASVAATLDYVGDTRRLVCAGESRPRLSLWGTHVGGETVANLYGFAGPARIFSAVGRTQLPIDEWLATGAIGALPPANIELAVTPVAYESLAEGAPVPTIESGDVPFLCEYFTGPFSGRASIEHLFTDHPSLGGTLFSEHMQFHRLERSTRGTVRNALADSPEIPAIALKFSGDAEQLRFNHDMTWWGEEQVTQVRGFVGWNWNAANPVPEFAEHTPFDFYLDAPMESSADDTTTSRAPSSLPLQLLTGWIPLFGRVEGSMEAQVHGSGTLDAPVFDGQLRIRDGTIVLASIGQRLRNVQGIIDLDADGATVRELVARDQDGSIRAEGVIDLAGWTATGFDLSARADSFPVRDEGSIIARLTGRAGLNGTIGDDDVASELTIDELDVQMVPQSTQSPIGLGEHPDIQIVGLSAPVPVDARRYPLQVHIAPTPRFWVRSEDFSAQVSTELNIVYASPDVRIAGTLEIHRGFFDVFGKRFEVDQGSMIFDGSPVLDPLVSLVARHQLRGGGRNDIVIVRASGTLSAPVVEFSSPLVSTGDQGQILCLLLTGNASGECGQSSAAPGAPSTTTSTAGTQAAQFLTSVAFGVATLALREQFGEFIPMLAVENGTNGSNIPRVRAGFNADRLIPEALRNVVRGIYIEGYYNEGARNGGATGSAGTGGTSQSNNTSLNSLAGFSIELQFPHNIVSEGEYALPNNWRIGVTWEP